MVSASSAVPGPGTPPVSGAAVVTGAARGIGAAITARLSAQGWKVVGVDTTEPQDQLATGWVRGDIRQPATLQSAVEAARRLGGLGAWVNNAGIQQDRARVLHTRSRAEIDTLMSINLLAPIHATAAAAAEFLITGTPGAIVNISSMHGGRPSRGWSMYAAAKAGLEGLTRAAAADYGPHGIRVNAIAPAQVLTASYTDVYVANMDGPRRALEEDLIRALQPLGRGAEPEEVAAVTAFLLGPDAASVSGVVLPVDGGRQNIDPYDALAATLADRYSAQAPSLEG